ncbi:MAG: chromosomal replication initiator protein DnaA [Helicobacteraceae bacterium]|jgi:chromosomal replication initiator protein|nr:chromosomal replication initiator protein DnaA [Helicobacteraceae bacterium]
MIFDVICNELKRRVPSDEYARYIIPLKFLERPSKSNLIVLEAPNPYIALYVENRYGHIIADFFEKESGTRPVVRIKARNAEGKKSAEFPSISENQSIKSTALNISYTFDSFVVGHSNKFAHTIAKALSENLGSAYNPVVIFGGVGLGKTHLLQAIGNAVQAQKKIVTYRKCENMLNDFIEHLRLQTMDRFREQYRNCDVLLIDDIQFLSGKENFQEEFFYTFEELHSRSKQIVLTADQPPKMIAGITERLKSRFMWGQIAEIQPPELETKIAIIKIKCEIHKINLANEIINYIASKLDNNVREIEGVLNNINIYCSMLGRVISLEVAKDILKNYLKDKLENITIDNIASAVAKEMNCKIAEIKSKSRVKKIVTARNMIIYLARKLTQNSMPLIAEYFGMKDHSAVSHAHRSITKTVDNDADFKLKIDALASKITEKGEK